MKKLELIPENIYCRIRGTEKFKCIIEDKIKYLVPLDDNGKYKSNNIGSWIIIYVYSDYTGVLMLLSDKIKEIKKQFNLEVPNIFKN